jgi:hypothetical protein
MKRSRQEENVTLWHSKRAKQGTKELDLSWIQSKVYSSIELDELEETCECAICKCWLTEPYILHCSHSFCKKCLFMWLKEKKSCPTCRKMVLKPPAPNKKMYEIIEKIMEFQTEDRDDFELRRMEHKYYSDMEFAKFQETIANAIKNGTKFLNIKQRWSAANVRVFRVGLERYMGRELIQYCDLTGLTKEYIKTATARELFIAARNVSAPIPQSSAGIDYDRLRKALEDVLTQ